MENKNNVIMRVWKDLKALVKNEAFKQLLKAPFENFARFYLLNDFLILFAKSYQEDQKTTKTTKKQQKTKQKNQKKILVFLIILLRSTRSYGKKLKSSLKQKLQQQTILIPLLNFQDFQNSLIMMHL